MSSNPAGSRAVVDASVVIKWYVQEVHFEAACRLLADDAPDLHVPDLVFPEVGNILWKKVRRGEIAGDRAREIVQLLEVAPIEVHPSVPLLGAAIEIALSTGRTVYDTLYIASAVSLDCRMVTADERLYNSLKDGTLSDHIRWLDS